MLINKTILPVSLVCLIGLSGCASDPARRQPPTSPRVDDLQQAFVESARQVSTSMRLLAEMENARLTADPDQAETMRQTLLNARTLPAGLDKPITIDWHGEAEPLLRLIAKLTDYGPVRVFGTRPQGGAVVRVRAVSRPAYDIIREVGAMLGRRARIRVIAADGVAKARGVIELEYAGYDAEKG